MDVYNYIGSVIPFLVALLLGSMIRTSSKAKRKNGCFVVEYGLSIQIFALIIAALTILLLADWFNVLTIFPAKTENNFKLMIIVTIIPTSFYLVMEFVFVSIRYDKNNIYCFSNWRKNRTIDWSAVESVKFSNTMKWWIVTTKEHGKIRLHIYLSGLDEFLSELNARGLKDT